MKRNPNQPKTHTNPAQNPASSPARPALSSGPKPQPKIQPSPKTPARSNHCTAQLTSSPRRPAWPSHAARSLSPLLPLTSWLSQATPRAPISLGPPASAPARPRGPAATARQRHVSLAPSLRSAASRALSVPDRPAPPVGAAPPADRVPARPTSQWHQATHPHPGRPTCQPPLPTPRRPRAPTAPAPLTARPPCQALLSRRARASHGRNRRP